MSDEKNKLLIDLAKCYPDLTISIKCSDLIDAFRSIIDENKLQKEQIVKEESFEEDLTEIQVRKLLDISRATLHRWHKSKYLQHYKIGRKNRYRKTDVYAILNMNEI